MKAYIKRFTAAAAAFCMSVSLAGCVTNITPAESSVSDTGNAEIQTNELEPAFSEFQDTGRVLSAELNGDEAYIVSEGLYGIHMDEDPAVTLGVTISGDGFVKNVTLIDTRGQTAGFGELITDEYLTVYRNHPARDTIEVDSISGATITCLAATYAVRTAAYYANNVYGFLPDTNADDIAELKSFFEASYTAVSTDYTPDARAVGTVLFAAEGVTDDGIEVTVMKVRSARRFDHSGTARTGWDSAEPYPFTMLIAVDKALNSVVSWKIVVDGTVEKEYFTVPDEIIDLYKTVTISSEDVYDNFEDGLVIGLQYETQRSDDGPIITGTSIVFTGATASGTFSSQLIRNCFKAAAYFYCNY